LLLFFLKGTDLYNIPFTNLKTENPKKDPTNSHFFINNNVGSGKIRAIPTIPIHTT
jgi:hypothetical protein